MARHAQSVVLLCAALVVMPTTQGCAPAPLDAYARLRNTSTSLLTGDEIRRNRIDNAYDAVRHLRPLYLNSRGPTSVVNPPREQIVVILNGQVFGGLEELRLISAREIAWVRRLSAAEAYNKIGRPAPSGAIELRVEPCRGTCP